MRRTSIRPDSRPGFTLVELLVVMTIIAILFALTSAAVVKAMVKMDESRTRNDISQLQVGARGFMTDFGVAYIPDKLVLPPALDPVSNQYISSLWPRMPATILAQPGSWGVPPGKQFIVLQGYQTLVFFLGGAADPSGSGARVGFSTNPTLPLDTSSGSLGAANRKGPYFDFPPARLQLLPSDGQTQKNVPYPAFIDTYGTMPYLYFSASKSGNDYNSTYNTSPPSNNNPYTGPQTGSTAAGTTFSVLPFQIGGTSTSMRFANANGYQIISAGKDGMFGNGGTTWIGYPGGSTSMQGYDDVSNFHPTLLGIPAN
jgi:prepilin-type N-terminal cleavage/methylation domain-containing protein